MMPQILDTNHNRLHSLQKTTATDLNINKDENDKRQRATYV